MKSVYLVLGYKLSPLVFFCKSEGGSFANIQSGWLRGAMKLCMLYISRKNASMVSKLILQACGACTSCTACIFLALSILGRKSY